MHGGYLDFIHHYLGKHIPKKTKKRIEQLEHQVNLGSITERQFYVHIQEEFGVYATPQQMHERIVKKMKTNKSLVAFIPKIKKSKVALFSNSIGHMAIETLHARHLDGKKVFDKVFLSNDMHLAKPSKSSYEYVVQHLKVKPYEALMVDDRVENIVAAKKAGLQGIVFKTTAEFKKDLKKYTLE